MEPTEIYTAIQPIIEQDFKRMFDSEIENGIFSFSDVQAHSHNGSDSPQLPFDNLSDADSYLAIQRTTLSTAQVKALNTTPIAIVKAPVQGNFGGAGLAVGAFKAVNIVLGITAYLSYGGTAYTGANALEFRYTDGSGSKVTADMSTTFLNAATSSYDYVAGVTTELVPIANGPVVVRVPTANPATGNSPITFVVHYRVVPFV